MIIFLVIENYNKSVYYNFCATPYNNLKKYYKKIIILMGKMGYVQGKFHNTNEYELSLIPKEILIDLDLKKDTDKATDLTYRIFKEVYRETNIKVWVQ